MKVLDANLRALAHYHPGLQSLIPESAGPYGLVMSGDGAPGCHCSEKGWIHGPNDPAREAADTVSQLIESDDRFYVFVRPGFGYLPLALLDALGERATESRFLILEDRLSLLRLALENLDWTPILAARAVALGFGPMLPTLERFLVQRPTIARLPVTILVEGNSVRDDTDLPQQVLNLVSAAADYAKERSENALTAAKNTRSWRRSAAPRVLLGLGADDYLTKSVVAGFQEAGCDTELRAVATPIAHFGKDVDWTFWLPERAPDILFWTNRPYIGASAATALRDLGVQNVLWSFDDPRAMRVTRADFQVCDLYLSYDASHVTYATEMGARRAAQLSTAVGLAPIEGAGPSDNEWPERLGPQLSFVGRLTDERYEQLRAAFERGDPVLLKKLARVIESGEQIEAVLPDLRGPNQAAAFYYVNGERTLRRRRQILESVMHLGLQTYGEPVWGNADVTGGLASCYAGTGVAYGPTLARLYYNTLINLNVFHAQCVDSTNSRIYDVLAAGGFLLTEDSPRVREEFEVGRHLVTFRSPGDALEKARYFLEHPVERDAIAREGQRHVLANHTYKRRAEQVLQWLGHAPSNATSTTPTRVELAEADTIPVFLNNRDRLSSLRRMVEDVRRMGGRPIVVDNASTFPPLLEWYETKPCEILRLGANVGAYGPWNSGIAARAAGYYVVTDTDLDLSACPADCLAVLREAFDTYPWATKVGLSLRTDDVPAHFAEAVTRYEGAYWTSPLSERFYRASIDTTFALYHVDREARPHSREFFYAARSSPPYMARHLPWYLEPRSLDAEEQYYLDHCRRGSSFSSWSNVLLAHQRVLSNASP